MNDISTHRAEGELFEVPASIPIESYETIHMDIEMGIIVVLDETIPDANPKLIPRAYLQQFHRILPLNMLSRRATPAMRSFIQLHHTLSYASDRFPRYSTMSLILSRIAQ